MLVEGAKEVTLFGEKVQVNAQIHNLEGFSGHADKDGLMDWLRGFQKIPKKLFLVHGEPDAKNDFAQTVRQELGFDVVVVNANSEYELEPASGEVLSMQEAMAEAVDEKTINEARHNLFVVRRRLEDIIYNTDLAVTPETSPEQLAKINNIILELEKSAINLGATLTEGKDGTKDIELTPADKASIAAAKELEQRAKDADGEDWDSRKPRKSKKR